MKTVGRAYFDRPSRWWSITCEPHVMVDLKRVFPKVNAKQLGTVHLSDSPDTARRLLWFAQLHRLEFEPAGYAERRRDEFLEQQTLIERILADGYRPSANSTMAIAPRDYQAQAAALVLATGSLLLGDDLGTGKSFSAMAMISDVRARPALYVTLTALPKQVQAMMAKALPGLRTHVLKQGQPYDVTAKPFSRTGEKLPFPDVIITSWSKLSGWAETLAKMGLRSVVFDEIHELRHPGSAKYIAAKHIAESTQYRLGMSGTPIFGMGSQIFHVLEVLRPGALGTWEEFRREHCGDEGGEKPALVDPDAFGHMLRSMGLMLRRTREDVGRQIPSLQRIMQPVDIESTTLSAEDNSRAIQLAIAVLQASGTGEERMRAAGELDWKLRLDTGIRKARPVADFVEMLLEAGEKVLLTGWHRAVYDIWKERLAAYKPAFYTGDESAAEKDEAKQRFCDPHHKDPTNLLIMSVRSGVGLDGLQHSGCAVVVHGELDWAPAVHQQADGRVHRDGQTKPVMAYYCVADSGSDPIVRDVLGLKEAQLSGIIDPNAAKTVVVPDQAAIKRRMQRLAASYLEKHDPKALHRIPGAVELLLTPEPTPPPPPRPAPEPPPMTAMKLSNGQVVPGRPYTVEVARPAPPPREPDPDLRTIEDIEDALPEVDDRGLHEPACQRGAAPPPKAPAVALQRPANATPAPVAATAPPAAPTSAQAPPRPKLPPVPVPRRMGVRMPLPAPRPPAQAPPRASGGS